MFIMPSLIKMYENSINMLGLPGKSAAKADEDFYDTDTLSAGERQQAMALLAEQKAVEGSIFVLYPNDPDQFPRDRFDVFCANQALTGRSRGEMVVQDFEDFLKEHPEVAIDTVVIPGCGSSPLGAAALGKAVAEIIRKPVAAIVAGEGAFDLWMEAGSGGTLMAPMANALNAFDKILEFSVKTNPIVKAWAQMYIKDLSESMHEAATLCALLRTRLVDEKIILCDRKARGLDMIISHSKGNWNVLVALLSFEFELADSIVENNPGHIKAERRIDVVTFGNPVDLPDQHEVMRALFHYHQFAGTRDLLMLLNSSKTLVSGMLMEGKVHPTLPFNPSEDPDLRLFDGCRHNLIKKREDHMPIEEILPKIREAA
jgi:hypothetical protein